jgi:hypothetical protein
MEKIKEIPFEINAIIKQLKVYDIKFNVLNFNEINNKIECSISIDTNIKTIKNIFANIVDIDNKNNIIKMVINNKEIIINFILNYYTIDNVIYLKNNF